MFKFTKTPLSEATIGDVMKAVVALYLLRNLDRGLGGTFDRVRTKKKNQEKIDNALRRMS